MHNARNMTLVCVCMRVRARACAWAQKWLIRTHTRSPHLCVFARTGPCSSENKAFSIHSAYVHLGTRHTQQLFSLRLPESASEWQICTYVTKFDNQLQVSVSDVRPRAFIKTRGTLTLPDAPSC